jgi:hypothetical protein
VAAAIRDGLAQRRSPRLCATAANATYLLPGLISRQEAVGALRALLERHADEAGRPLVYRDREARNWNYARKRAAAALREIATPDPELLAALQAGLEQVRSWRGRAGNEEDRRGLEETLEEALEQIQARGAGQRMNDSAWGRLSRRSVATGSHRFADGDG